MKSLLVRQRIKALREKAGLSTTHVGLELGMDKRTYERIECGHRKNLDIDLLADIAGAIGVHLADLFPSEEEVQERILARSAELEKTGITVVGSTTELTPEAQQLRIDYREIILQQAHTIHQQAVLIERLTQEKVA